MGTTDRSGDGWVTCARGHRHWGRYGAAGLLLVADGRVLLQLRAEWSHHGGTWGIPGGALARGETAVEGALRETLEEAGIVLPPSAVTGRSVVDHGGWSYATVLAAVEEVLPVVPDDGESDDLRWVPVDQVEDLLLHPGFAASWPGLAAAAGVRLRIVVDGANVVGSRPDGWWRDRAGAAQRLRDRLAGLEVPGDVLPDGLAPPLGSWSPEVVLVVEGAARRTIAVANGPGVVAAPGSGDDEIVRQAAEGTIVVTSDADLQSRCRAVGAVAVGASWLLRLLDAA
ncbi:ADP-ribose pyrophosphatase YjhB (NUDIX family) [Motilibacter rhizosphaerae]|uniref:ADP-ribose pyrophosphatase YjhB (NUDIX family) n=1 Tax=Motilibacter rhizosphaerae TaxID=598652 RepID=A0A4V2F2E3_9ACTN|nr:NUDIX domain-containing protein [Motilibacter rhizosphaerae]RZS77526.1 ADP-ribose pyrophosphatase YjhB (NUDIX family) [Motilibacter rhizosphaerae]